VKKRIRRIHDSLKFSLFLSAKAFRKKPNEKKIKPERESEIKTSVSFKYREYRRDGRMKKPEI